MNHRSLHTLLDQLGGQRRINYSLERFEAALAHLGNPEKAVYSLVVSGTNGKGTTALLVSAGLIAQGHRVGTFLSPHLQHPKERFLAQLTPTSPDELDLLANEFYPTAEKFDLTYFEFLTLLYFVWAKRSHFEFSVLEVGLGGRLDAVNVTDAIACVVTNIGLDHQAYLGDTVEKILEEKLGILRSESLLFTGIRDPKLLDRVQARCGELDAIYYFARELRVEPGSVDWSGQSFFINGYPFSIGNASQGTQENAALAFLTLRVAFPKISIETLQRAFASVHIPGRLEIVQRSPRVVLSGDHNPAGIENLKRTLQSLGNPAIKTICAFSPDKPYPEMYRELAKLSREIWLTQVDRLKSDTTDAYRNLGPYEPDAKKLVARIIAESDGSETILITGSLYLIGEVRILWQKEVGFLRGIQESTSRSPFLRDAANPARLPLAEPARSHAP